MNFKFDGYVDIELVDSKTGEIKHKSRSHNTITPAGLKSFLATCLTPYLQNSQIILGNRTVAPVGFTYTMGTSGLYTYNKANSGLISPLLLNIDQTNGVKVSSESFVDFLDDSLFISEEKLIGYGLNNISPSADGKEGTVEYPNAATLLDDYTIGIRFKYPEGVATGDINAVAMVPISDFSHNLTLYTTKNLIQVAVGSSPSPVAPNLICPAYCGDCADVDAVGLDYTSDGLKGYLYDFLSGEITQKEVTQGVARSYCDNTSNWFVDVANGYAYRCYNNGQYCYIYVYNIATGSQVRSITLSGVYYTYSDLLYLDGSLYIVLSGNHGNSSSIKEATTKVYKMTGNTSGYFTSYDSSALTLESLGVNVPDGACYLIGSRRSDISEYEVRGVEFRAYGANPNLSPSYAFTSLSNVHGSIIGVRGSGAVGSGLPISKSNPKARFYSTQSQSNFRSVANNSSSGLSVNADQYSSTFVSDSGNALSVYLLSSPVTKGENDILHVTYGYKISS